MEHLFTEVKPFFIVFLQWKGFGFAPPRGSPVSVNDHFMTTQFYWKVDHLWDWVLSLSLAKDPKISVSAFFSFLQFDFILATKFCSLQFFSGSNFPQDYKAKLRAQFFCKMDPSVIQNLLCTFQQVYQKFLKSTQISCSPCQLANQKNVGN